MRIHLPYGLRLGRKIMCRSVTGDGCLQAALDSIAGEVERAGRVAGIEQDFGLLETDVREILKLLPVHAGTILAGPGWAANCVK